MPPSIVEALAQPRRRDRSNGRDQETNRNMPDINEKRR